MSYPYHNSQSPPPPLPNQPQRPIPIQHLGPSPPPPQGQPQAPPQQAGLHPRFATPPPRPAAYASDSNYSLSSYGEEEKYDRLTAEDDDESRPLHGSYGYPPAQGPIRFGTPVSAGVSRRETSAAAWQRRQRAPLSRAQTKMVKLTNGHFIADFPVPTAVASANRNAFPSDAPQQEYTHLRYTAATCDPDDFVPDQGWSLRQTQYNRQTDLLIAITYYNEDKILVARTLHGVMVNVRDMVKAKWSEFRKNSEKTGEKNAWKRIVVSLIFDGIGPADKSALDVLATIGIYQDALIKSEVDGKKTTGHIFEYSTALSMSPTPALIQPVAGDPNNLVPVQMIFCLKAENGKKINSHRWLFNGLCAHLNPEVCVLLDAGTKPGKHSIYYLWEAFFHDRHLGGACGEIHAQLKGGKKLINPLVAAQNFEYKMSNILDKPTESSFGYVSVLPGAFSAYRFRAIKGRPLQQYFHGDHTLAARLGPKGILGMSIFKKNMFLAEDRILCFELVAKANERWLLGYVKPSKAETDVPESGAELIGQRRRWLNGSFAAGIYSLAHFHRLYRSNHNPIRLLFLHVQGIYQLYNLMMSWFQPGNYFVTFSVILDIINQSSREPYAIKGATDDVISCWQKSPFGYTGEEPNESYDYLGVVNLVLNVLYVTLVAFQVILALGNRPKGERLIYNLSFAIFGILALWLLFNTLILTAMAICPMSGQISDGQADGKNVLEILLDGSFLTIMAGLLGTFGIYVITSILYFDPWHLFHSMPQFLCISISFTNILNVYAFCNLHDVSWGTKGSDKEEALPGVQSKKDKDSKTAVAEVVQKVQEDVDSAFEATVKRAIAPFESEEEIEKPTPDDLNKTFRTRFVSVWLFSNAILSLVVSRLGADARTKYFMFILWSTFGLSAVRFIGFVYYMIGESLFRAARLCTRRRK